MSSQSEIEKIKQLREITGVGFKDCKTAIDETKWNIDKAIDFLRKKGISKALSGFSGSFRKILFVRLRIVSFSVGFTIIGNFLISRLR